MIQIIIFIIIIIIIIVAYIFRIKAKNDDCQNRINKIVKNNEAIDEAQKKIIKRYEILLKDSENKYKKLQEKLLLWEKAAILTNNHNLKERINNGNKN